MTRITDAMLRYYNSLEARPPEAEKLAKIERLDTVERRLDTHAAQLDSLQEMIIALRAEVARLIRDGDNSGQDAARG